MAGDNLNIGPPLTPGVGARAAESELSEIGHSQAFAKGIMLETKSPQRPGKIMAKDPRARSPQARAETA